jgi:LytS/YehU family sensor histidine kinase
LALLDAYLAIQQARFDERLHVSREISSNLLEALVPTLILQPLVENAIKHGLENRREKLNIVISAESKGGTLTLRVADNGPGIRGPEAPQRGIGLGNTRARLQELYGSRQSFTLRENQPSGTTAEVVLPWMSTPQLAGLKEDNLVRS